MAYRVKAQPNPNHIFRRSGLEFRDDEWKVVSDEEITPEILAEPKLIVQKLATDGQPSDVVVPSEDPRLAEAAVVCAHLQGELDQANDNVALLTAQTVRDNDRIAGLLQEATERAGELDLAHAANQALRDENASLAARVGELVTEVEQVKSAVRPATEAAVAEVPVSEPEKPKAAR